MKQEKNKNDFLGKVKNMSQNTQNAIALAAEKMTTAIDEKKAASKAEQKEKFDAAMLPLIGTEAEKFIVALEIRLLSSQMEK